jgi:hypothetical protein
MRNSTKLLERLVVKAIHSATLDPLPELEAPSEAREAPVAPSEDENRGVFGIAAPRSAGAVRAPLVALQVLLFGPRSELLVARGGTGHRLAVVSGLPAYLSNLATCCVAHHAS